jgi:23S rRNA pseudouridine1911/1915/1917 synthase
VSSPPGGGSAKQRFELGPGTARDRLDKILTRLLPATSRSTVQRWIDEDRVSVDGKAAKARDHVGPGAVIEVEPGARPPSDAEPDAAVTFGVLYDDDELIVVDKPAGLVVHPARGHASGTLVNGLLARPGFERAVSDPRDPAGSLRPGIVHRIDKDTSGVLVIAKTEHAREHLKAQLSAHTVERLYLGLTVGVPSPGVIRSHYGRHPRSRLRFSSLVKEGKHAVTHVAVRERLAGGRAALVECRLETGRTHQIRVHLSEQRKTPLFADALYGRAPAQAELAAIASELGRHALHAAVLGFVHPTRNEQLRFEAPLPPDFERALAALRALAPVAR